MFSHGHIQVLQKENIEQMTIISISGQGIFLLSDTTQKLVTMQIAHFNSLSVQIFLSQSSERLWIRDRIM